jgi:hypothetical protein
MSESKQNSEYIIHGTQIKNLIKILKEKKSITDLATILNIPVKTNNSLYGMNKLIDIIESD